MIWKENQTQRFNYKKLNRREATFGKLLLTNLKNGTQSASVLQTCWRFKTIFRQSSYLR